MHVASVAYDIPLTMVAWPQKRVRVILINKIYHCEKCEYLLVCLDNLFIIFLINKCNDCFIPPLLQLVLFPKGINKFMYHKMYCLTSCLDQFWNSINAWWFVSFKIFNSCLNHNSTGSGTSGRVVCISVCLTFLIPCTLNKWQKLFFHLFKITWECASRVTLLIFTNVVSGW
jgi:hypothetical protein